MIPAPRRQTNAKIPFCCPVCQRVADRPAKIIAQGACCCFHALDPNFVPTPEQVEEAERWRTKEAAPDLGLGSGTDEPLQGP